MNKQLFFFVAFVFLLTSPLLKSDSNLEQQYQDEPQKLKVLLFEAARKAIRDGEVELTKGLVKRGNWLEEDIEQLKKLSDQTCILHEQELSKYSGYERSTSSYLRMPFKPYYMIMENKKKKREQDLRNAQKISLFLDIFAQD